MNFLVKNPSEEFCLGKKTKKELKKAIVKFKETLQDPSEDEGNEQAEGNTEEYEASNGQEHQASSTEEETSEESEEIEPEDKEQNEQKEEDNEQEDEEEDEQQEENKDESDEEENNEPMDQQHDGICGSTMHQPEEFEESKDAQIADLRQRLKALSQSKKEEDRNWIELRAEKDISIRILTSHNSELQEKESTIQMKLRMLEVEKANDTKTIQQLRCSNSELETENAKLHEQVQELSIQLVTQPYRTPTQLQPQVGMQVEQQPTTQQEQMAHKEQPKQKTKLYVKKDPTPMIKNLKAKERKEKQHDPEFQYPKVAKVTRASKQAAKQVEQSTKDKEVLDADAALIWTSENCQQSWRNYRFLHFPINTGGDEKSTHGNHWTLLVLDKQENLWRFYNSLRPRRDDAEDKYVKDAKQLQDYVENFLKKAIQQNSSEEGTAAAQIDDAEAFVDNDNFPVLNDGCDGQEGGEVGAKDEEDIGDNEEDNEDEEQPAEFVNNHITDRKKKKDFEIFIGRLDKGAVEDDLIEVFGKFGEIKAARIVRNPTTNKMVFSSGKVRGKHIIISASQDNDTLYMGNICKLWTKERVLGTLKSYGIENIEEIYLPADPQKEGKIKGFALLEFSTHSDAMAAFQRL
ncbi:unnamed protein product [Camellia sinensis]